MIRKCSHKLFDCISHSIGILTVNAGGSKIDHEYYESSQGVTLGRVGRLV